MPFRALNLSPQILQAVQEAGYTEPTPIQVAAIPHILAGHDLIGIAQTGTGKTAAFVLPILTKLAAFISNGQRRRHARAGGCTDARARRADRGERARLRETSAVAHGHGLWRRERTPADRGVAFRRRSGRRHARAVDRFDGPTCRQFSGIEFLVLDEADRMLDMGFLPPIRQIVKALPQKRQTLMFSASLSREIEKLTHEFQQSPKIVEIGRRANPADTVTQLVYEVAALEARAAAPSVGRSAIRHGPCLYPHETRRRSHRASTREQRNQDRNDPFEPFAESAAPRVEGFQVRRRAGAGRDRYRGARNRRGWNFACGELRFPDALGGLRPSHRTHRSRACDRRRDQLHYAGGSRPVALARAFHRTWHRAQTGGRIRLQCGRATAR